MGSNTQTPGLSPAALSTQAELADVVAGLRLSREVTHKIRHRGSLRELPSRAALEKIRDGLMAALFPSHYGCPDLTDETIDYFVGHTLAQALTALTEQIRRDLLFLPPGLNNLPAIDHATLITRNFATLLPELRGMLAEDLTAAYHGDPAASSVAEVLIAYPGMRAIVNHRLAHALHGLGAPLVARLLASISQAETGIDIHPQAQIGARFFIDHGTGVVIGQTAIIGANVRLYQHVTLGAKSFVEDENGVLIKGEPRHPIIEDNVVIYAGATVLGRIVVGHGSTIGGNVWLTQSVPPGSFISQAQNRLTEV
jgi:serine O-acetyltransferase